MRAFAFLGLLSIVSAASASETITYVYDARGRLVQVVRSGTVNDGVTTNYTIDKADNRTNVTVSTVDARINIRTLNGDPKSLRKSELLGNYCRDVFRWHYSLLAPYRAEEHEEKKRTCGYFARHCSNHHRA